MVPTGFIPDEDQGVLLASITLPDGASLSRTEDVGLRLIEQIRNLEGVDEKRLMLFGGNGATNTATAIISLDDYADRKISPVDWVKRKIEGRPTDLSHTAILSRIRAIASKTKEASIVVFSPPAISGMSMLGGFEFQMLSQGEYTPQELEAGQTNLYRPQIKIHRFQVCIQTFRQTFRNIHWKLTTKKQWHRVLICRNFIQH